MFSYIRGRLGRNATLAISCVQFTIKIYRQISHLVRQENISVHRVHSEYQHAGIFIKALEFDMFAIVRRL